MKRRNALSLRFTPDVATLEAIKLDLSSGMTVEVFGDPDNATYEWCLVRDDGMVEQHSDCGYGIPSIALRDALVVFYGPPPFDVEIVDLRLEEERAQRPYGMKSPREGKDR